MITVALPLWRAKDVAWICLESLCRQKVIIPWELIICEEQTQDKFGLDGVEQYIDRLRDAGMVDLNYIIQEKRVRLAHKWRRIAQMANDDSVSFHMCGADNFYQPYTLQNGYDGVKDGADWFSTYECHFYDINTHKLVRYFNRKYSGIEMAFPTEMARRIRGSNKGKGIDLYIYRSLAPKNRVWNETENGLKTVCTHGRNYISWNRGPLINNVRSPFRETEYQLNDLLPSEIIERLCSED